MIDCSMVAQLLVADSQDAALRVELAVHMTDGDSYDRYLGDMLGNGAR